MTVDAQDGVWHVDGCGANPYRTAALAATELGRVNDHVVAVVRSSGRAVLVAVAGRTMALADSRTVVWRLYELSSTRTPASLAAGSAGPPPGGRTCRLMPSPPEIEALGDALGVDLAELVREMRER
jgi:hypothetical protein